MVLPSVSQETRYGLGPQQVSGSTRSRRFWAGGVAPVTTTTGTDVTPVSGTVYYAEIDVTNACLATGVGYLIGSVGGTDKAIAALYDAGGTVLANSALAGTTVGTSATIQQLAFTTPYLLKPGRYFISISVNGTTCRLRCAAVGIHFTNSATGTFGTLAAITPPTSFAADKGPIAAIY